MTDICVLLCCYHLKVNRLLCTQPPCGFGIEWNFSHFRGGETSLYFSHLIIWFFSLDLLQSLLLSSLLDLCTLSLSSSMTLLFQPSTSSRDEQEKKFAYPVSNVCVSLVGFCFQPFCTSAAATGHFREDISSNLPQTLGTCDGQSIFLGYALDLYRTCAFSYVQNAPHNPMKLGMISPSSEAFGLLSNVHVCEIFVLYVT